MIQTKFIELYQKLDSNEKEGLHKWIFSPIHNSDEYVSKLFIYLASRRKISKVSVAKERVYKAIYNEDDYDVDRLYYLISKAFKLLQDFLVFWMLKNDSNFWQKKVVEMFNNKKMPQQATKQLEKGKKQLHKTPKRNQDFYFEQYELEREAFILAGTEKRTSTTNLQSIMDNLSMAFVIEHLRLACIAITHQNLYKTSYDAPLLSAILLLSQEKEYLKEPAVQLYFNAYSALKSPDEETYFQNLVEGLAKYSQLLKKEESRSLYIIAINYCIKRLNTGTDRYIRIGFELYQRGITDSILWDESSPLSRFAYNNAIALGLRLDEFEWVTLCIEEYSSVLDEIYRERYKHYTTAKLHFAKKEYKIAMRLLAQAEYDDLFLNIDSKMMLVKMYYEQGSVEPLDALLNSFSKFIQRKSVMTYHKQNYNNIIRVVRKMIDLAPSDQKMKKKVIFEINNTQPLTERQWLLKQLSK